MDDKNSPSGPALEMTSCPEFGAMAMSGAAASPNQPRPSSGDRALLRLAAVLLISGFLIFFVVSLFHAGTADPNSHRAVFAQYAASSSWIAVHLGIFAGFAAMVLGVYLLFSLFRDGRPAIELSAQVGLVCTGVALGLTAARYAVDGVVLKRAVDAWVATPAPLKPGRFAAAEAVRALEEALSSYQGIVLGVAMVLLAVLIIVTRRITRPVGYLLGVAGIASVASGWILGTDGFAMQGSVPTQFGQACIFAAGIWLLARTWRTPSATPQPLPEQRADVEPAEPDRRVRRGHRRGGALT
ncbi:hypothetical protein [Terrabacter sp. BE26]|uniref:hypothetical protein n=1 Tax=Terrabacter sp. BE26 TaxID=2898152 RepID=UPI0035BE9304